MCYTVAKMNADHHIWQVWSTALHRWGMQDWTAALLEAAGPLTVLGAQVVYIGQPLLKPIVPPGHLEALAQLLEDNHQTQAFIAFLREDPSQ